MDEKTITITLSVSVAEQLARAAENGMMNVYVSRYQVTEAIEDIRRQVQSAYPTVE